MGIKQGFLRFDLPTPDCPRCGPSDYEKDISSVSPSKITDPIGTGITSRWVCVQCQTEMPKPYLEKKETVSELLRIGVDEYFLEITKLVARRATCARRRVGCVLVNEHNHILATGYNGVAKGVPHCIDKPCPGAHCASGTGLHLCQAIHAEQNALLQCRNINEVSTCYTTSSPCVHCLRLLLNTSCKKIVFAEEYPHPEAKAMWVGDGREWIHKPIGFSLPVRQSAVLPKADVPDRHPSP